MNPPPGKVENPMTDLSNTASDVVVLNETVTHLPSYNGHWKGEAHLTHHTYGHQVHRTRTDAERWNEAQRELRPVSVHTVCTGQCDEL